MSDASFNNSAKSVTMPVLRLSVRHRLAMVLLGYIPILHLIVVALLIVLPLADLGPRSVLWLAPVVFYVVPPVVVRATLAWCPLEDGSYGLKSWQFLQWWFCSQWQMVFNRLPALEEVLRLVPGLYSAWMRLWGARVGSLVYWSPGTVILDRPLLDVGSRTVLGVGARVHPHLIMRGKRGEAILLLGRVRLGDETLIGGLSTLLPGVHVHDGEELRGGRPVAPFSEYQNGRCMRHKHWLEGTESLFAEQADEE